MSPRLPRCRWRTAALILFSPLLLLGLTLLSVRLFVFPRGRYHLSTTSLSLQSADGVALSALLLEGSDESLVIVVHPFAGSARTPAVICLAEDLAGEFDVLALDLRGHGRSGGRYRLDFESVVPDVRAAVDWAEAQGYRHIGLVGFSLGGAAGVIEQARYDNLDSLVTVGGPATEQMAGTFRPWMWSGVGRMVFGWFGVRIEGPSEPGPWPAEVAWQVAPVPLLVVHGERDRVVPEEVSRALYAAAREPKAYLGVPDGGHAVLGERQAEVKDWLRDTLLLAETVPPAWAHFLERSLAEPPLAAPDEYGILGGTVYGGGGMPLEGAIVVASTEAGRAFHAYSGAAGDFWLALPAGRYVPIAAAPGYEAALFRSGSDPRTPVEVAAGGECAGVQFTLRPHQPWHPDTAAISLTLSPSELASATQPRPVQVQRRSLAFAHEGRRIDTCILYEPLTATAPMPVILAVYPSEAWRWNLVSIPLAAEGYVVLACGPPYLEKLEDVDLPAFARDLIAAWTLLEEGRISVQADPSRYGVLTGSISTFILSMALPDMPSPRVVVGIGGGYDMFLVLRDLYERPDYALDERFVMGVSALGRPDLYPETFFSVSLRYHAAELPLMGLFHSVLDEVLLVDQAEVMAASMEELGRPVQLFRYEALAHYPGVEDPPPETLKMYEDIVGMLEVYLKRGE